MITEAISSSLKMVARQLSEAETELNRPQDDVVTISACQTIRNSMKDMMEIYLSANAIPLKQNASLDDLLIQCTGSSQAFSAVDLSNIECKGIGHNHCDGKYCLSVDNVTFCVNAANQLKSVVWNEFKVSD